MKNSFKTSWVLVALFALAAQALVFDIGSDPVLVVNKGTGGNTTVDGLARFTRDVLEVNPNHLILYFGMNDSNNQDKYISVGEFTTNMQNMIDQAVSNSIETVVLVTPNPIFGDVVIARSPGLPFDTGVELEAHFELFRQAVHDLAASNSLPLVDLYAAVNANGGRDVLVRNALNGAATDGVHLTAEGYELFGGLFNSVFTNSLEAGDTVVCLGDSITYGAHMTGQGTIFGDTYPAWLSVNLNKMKGLSPIDTPPALPADPVVYNVMNGQFEESADQAHADWWKLWNNVNHDGTEAWVFDSAQSYAGHGSLRVVSGTTDYARLTHPVTMTVSAGEQYLWSFRGKGVGQLRPILIYKTGTISQPVYPAIPEYTAMTGDWVQGTLSYTVPEGVTGIQFQLYVYGDVLLDDFRFELQE